MALSQPERGTFDPKAHLQPSIDEIGLDRDTYQPPPQHHLGEPPQKDSIKAMNAAACQANAISSTHDFAPPSTNGFHTVLSPPLETQASQEFSSSAPASADTAFIQLSSPAPANHSTPDRASPAESLHSQEAIIEPAPAVVQQSTSDWPEVIQPGTQSNGMDRTIADAHEDHQRPLRMSDSHPLDAAHPPSDLSSSAATGEVVAQAPTPPQEEARIHDSPKANIGITAPLGLATANGELDNAIDDLGEGILQDNASEPPLDPAPSLVPTSATADQLPETGVNIVADHDMEDAPPPSKLGREREEDDLEEAPAAKRTKTDEGSTEDDFKVPDRPQVDTQETTQPAVEPEAEPETARPPSSPMTRLRQKHLQKALTNLKRIQPARPFLAPVDPKALNIPTYFDVIEHPMDLKTLEENLRAEKYSTLGAFLADFNQIVQNAQKFNGADHAVTKRALAMKENFERNIATLPNAETDDAPASKKKAPDPMAIRAIPAARRESRSSIPGSAKSPGSATSPLTFALGPEGVPLIRRDSTIDGRPKREIHRPAPKELPYSNQKPKKKKFQWELKFCEHVTKEMFKPRYQIDMSPFMTKVDPVALNIPTYFNVIKKPMDFGEIKHNLDQGEYENARAFEADVRLVFKNCYMFNPPEHPVHMMGKKMESIFNAEWSKKRDWLDEHIPSSGQRSPASSEDEGSEDDEEEEEGDNGQMEIVSKLQKQIAEMSKQVEMITSGAKKKTPPATAKKAGKPKATKKDTKKSAPAPAKADKKAAGKPEKKAKTPYVTYEQKQDISNRINSLSESKMTQALGIIRSNMPNLKGVQEDELELDIDELSNDVLYKLLQFVRKHAPRADDSPLPTTATSSSAAAPRKKNKPMSKTEQEARIAQVQSGLSAFQKGNAGSSASDVKPSIEDQSDDDDEEDSESEEE